MTLAAVHRILLAVITDRKSIIFSNLSASEDMDDIFNNVKSHHYADDTQMDCAPQDFNLVIKLMPWSAIATTSVKTLRNDNVLFFREKYGSGQLAKGSNSR